MPNSFIICSRLITALTQSQLNQNIPIPILVQTNGLDFNDHESITILERFIVEADQCYNSQVNHTLDGIRRMVCGL